MRWLQAARPLAHVNIAVPLLFGEMLAYHATGRLDVAMLVAAHLFGVLDQLYIVFANDVADEAGDRANETHNAFSGGSRVLPEGKITRRALATAAVVAALSMVALSIGLATFAARPAMLGGCALALLLLWAYSYAPLRLSYRGHGELTQGIGVGIVLPLVGWYLQVGAVDYLPWRALLPGALLAFASNISTALPDFPSDEAVGKRTWPVRFGQSRARKHSMQFIALAVLLTPLVLPGLEHAQLLAIEIGPALALLVNLRGLPNSDAADHKRCARFVFLNGLAINLALLGWIAALATL
ncbi:MAG: prenyltransferase [Myxococcota bacterium]